jgi:hypothetical protein
VVGGCNYRRTVVCATTRTAAGRWKMDAVGLFPQPRVSDTTELQIPRVRSGHAHSKRTLLVIFNCNQSHFKVIKSIFIVRDDMEKGHGNTPAETEGLEGDKMMGIVHSQCVWGE